MYDYIIIGGGIVGTSTAWQLSQRCPGTSILLLEKEKNLALHQTGRNSGVIHAGVYYQPGSLKSLFCRNGNDMVYRFCQEYGLPWENCGKLIVATNPAEFVRMEKLYQRARENLIDVEWLNRDQLGEREPHIVGVGAFLVRKTGITDYRLFTGKMAEQFNKAGGEIRLGTEVIDLKEMADEVRVETTKGDFAARHLITCAGLMSDRLVRMLGLKANFQIVPFRGEYYQLPRNKRDIIHHLIYPVPDPDLPFLGVHLTRMIDGSVTVGPNAVLALKREGYHKGDVSLRDLKEMAIFRGFWKMIRENLSSGIVEYKNSFFKSGYLGLIRKYCPEIETGDLEPYPAGVRAQAVDNKGALIHDFLFVNSKRSINVCNAPSPAATSALPIGGYILDQAARVFN
ncbi:MAG: L-2-hydroxyglutarate oxidase [Proteobacteria bacterium]|nr:L-2-hydroxyglutarate oxidase [Pseudomonadota bacterium]MBU1713856.1 L-2-hydroxyglutarate oxidase [Pseudomonadota bacterium]